MMIAQKWMLQRANHEAIPAFIQSQVLEGMLENDLTKARLETNEISTQVLDGADVFILSHETSIGKYGHEACIMLSKAIAEAENVFDYEQAFQDTRAGSIADGRKANVLDMLCTTAMNIALDNNVDLLVCVTETGRVARYLAKQRPVQTILACSTKGTVVRQVNSQRGVIGYQIPQHFGKWSICCVLE